MPFSAIEQYLERLEARQAETRILMADVIALPHMEKGDRKAMTRRWERQARAREAKGQLRLASPAMLKLMGIGVEVPDVG